MSFLTFPQSQFSLPVARIPDEDYLKTVRATLTESFHDFQHHLSTLDSIRLSGNMEATLRTARDIAQHFKTLFSRHPKLIAQFAQFGGPDKIAAYFINAANEAQVWPTPAQSGLTCFQAHLDAVETTPQKVLEYCQTMKHKHPTATARK